MPDRFADTFNEKLDKLNYQAPQLVVQQIMREYGGPEASLDVLDAGCGTGKGGVLLRPWARRLTGVDISGGMLAHARQTGSYDELIEEELLQYLSGHSEAFDLITVIDTFVYFGELRLPLMACASAIRAGGSLAFTVESDDDQPAGFRLTRTGRFVHGRDYLEECLSAAGFVDRIIVPVKLREEGNRPVGGFLVWAGLQA